MLTRKRLIFSNDISDQKYAHTKLQPTSTIILTDLTLYSISQVAQEER